MSMLHSKAGTIRLAQLIVTVVITTIDALGHFKQDNYSPVGWDRGCRLVEVRTCTTSPMPDHKGVEL